MTVGADETVLAERIRADPVWFCREVLGGSLWSKQREVIESVRDHQRTAVRSSHGVGKTAIAARAVLWWLYAYGPEALAITTAPTWRQVKNLLWREIAKAHAGSRFQLGGRLSETKLDFGPDWYAIGLSTRAPENFQGYHSPNLLFVGDEASGISHPIYEAAEGFLTAGNAHVLLIGNPTQVGGQFYDAFHRERSLWNTIHISTFDTPAFTGERVPRRLRRVLPRREWPAEMRERFGEDSPLYQVRVAGNFAAQSSRAVVGLHLVENALARRLEQTEEQRWPRIIGVDVARFGDDRSVITRRVGNRVEVLEILQKRDTVEVAAAALRWAQDDDSVSPLYGKPRFVVDDPGVGGGVTDQLRHSASGYDVAAFIGSAAAAPENDRELGYPNARSELWFEFAEDWLPGLELAVHPSLAGRDRTVLDQLAEELITPEYAIDAKSRRVVEPKDETKKRLGRSPDVADAAMVTCSRVAIAAASTTVPVGLAQPGGSHWRR